MIEMMKDSLLKGLIDDLGAPSSYRDRGYDGTDEDFKRDIANSSTLYVGNLSFYSSEEQLYSLFGRCGPVKRVIVGLDRHKKTPCGFCFIEYHTHGDASRCKKYLDGVKLDDRYLRVDIDPGFKEGRQYGRGRSGGQVRDELRDQYDSGRGGWGGLVLQSDRPDAKRAR